MLKFVKKKNFLEEEEKGCLAVQKKCVILQMQRETKVAPWNKKVGFKCISLLPFAF